MRLLAAAALALLGLTIWLGSAGALDPQPVTRVERPLVVPCGGGGTVGGVVMPR